MIMTSAIPFTGSGPPFGLQWDSRKNFLIRYGNRHLRAPSTYQVPNSEWDRPSERGSAGLEGLLLYYGQGFHQTGIGPSHRQGGKSSSGMNYDTISIRT